ERTGLYPNIVKTLIIRGSLHGAKLEFKEALRVLTTALNISKEKNFSYLERKARELFSRLKQREALIRPSEQKDYRDIGIQEVLTYIRLMTGRAPNLPTNLANLDTFYLLSVLITPEGQKILFYDNIPENILQGEKKFDPSFIGIYFSSILGGNTYNEGLFGPLPVPQLINFQALVFTRNFSNKNNENQFLSIIIIYEKSFDPLFYNRLEIERYIQNFVEKISNISEEINFSNEQNLELKFGIKTLLQNQIKEKIKNW
ncbi:MAG: hypothetical protein ACFFD1_10360, partial [Candidatus Thorarchaeota archaeon]